MRRDIIFFVGAIMMVVLVFKAEASSGGAPLWEKKAKPQQGKTTAVSPSTVPAAAKPGSSAVAPAAPTPEDIRRQRAIINMRRRQIDNTEWEIELIPMSGKGRNKKDVIRFSDRKVILKSLAKEGFTPTNFSLSLRSNKKLVWETMQKKDADIVFFKGEFSSELDSMTGVISFQRLRGTQDFSFRSTAKREVVPEESASE